MGQMVSYSGQDLRDMLVAASNWLEKAAAGIDAINVFPVPDGDTGTNMVLTMRSTVEETYRASDASVTAVAKAMAYGALMGARGNSGVILCQIFRGLARELEGKESFSGSDWARALLEASRTAYEGVSQPVEGTILTVIRDAATAADLAARASSGDLISVAEASVNEAKDSVARTPLLLPVLRDAGVVDAGGQGLYVLLEGILSYLKGESESMLYRKPQMVMADLPVGALPVQFATEPEEPYGYCTNFLIEGQKLKPDKIRRGLEKKGQSLVITGDETAVRVHIHTYDPGVVLRYATSLGTLHQIQIQNMDDQNVGFIEMQKEKSSALDIAVVAVASGDGMKEVFESLGVVEVVPGGQTMNPSVRELLKAVEAAPSEKVILLPNNKNIILTANQIQSLTSKEVAVVSTRTVPQGIAALLVFNYEGSVADNIEAMEGAKSTVKTVEITRAVRTTQIKGLKIKKGQVIGIIDDEDIVANGKDAIGVILEALSRVDTKSATVLTLYYGADVEAVQADETVQRIRDRYPGKQVDMIGGGQSHYDYVISIE